MHKLLFFLISIVTITASNCKSLPNCLNSTVDSTLTSDIHTARNIVHYATKSSKEDNKECTDHYCCQLCHAHVIILTTKIDSFTAEFEKSISKKFFYNIFYSSRFIASVFRPPIA